MPERTLLLAAEVEGGFGAEVEDEVEDGEAGDEAEAVGADLPVGADIGPQCRTILLFRHKPVTGGGQTIITLGAIQRMGRLGQTIYTLGTRPR